MSISTHFTVWLLAGVLICILILIPVVAVAILVPVLVTRRRRPAPVAPENTPLEVTVTAKREENGAHFVTFTDPNGFAFELAADPETAASLAEGQSGTLVQAKNRVISFE